MFYRQLIDISVELGSHGAAIQIVASHKERECLALFLFW